MEFAPLYSNSMVSFHHHHHQQDGINHNGVNMHDANGPSTQAISAFQFSQLNLQESMIGMETNSLPPPIPESEYSASYSAPGSAYSSDWSSASDHSSAQSQDEILEEIQRECAEIERKSVSPAISIRHKAHAKRRTTHTVTNLDNIGAASTSSASSIGNSERKKELNRIAATKYREKKRRERENLIVELEQLESRNHELRSTAKELKTEVNYLKKLMKDMELRARQL